MKVAKVVIGYRAGQSAGVPLTVESVQRTTENSTGLLEDLDAFLQTLGFRKIADLTPENLNRDVTEKCSKSSGVGGCSASVSGEFTLWESQFPLMGAIALYLEIPWCADFLPREGVPTCSINIEIIGEGDNYQVTLLKRQYSTCVYYA
ncbi:MAG: hypothetical protein DRO14_06085 [Thermoprotei archaeon]|nr:MAG: hypothetical protein DRO14_06085 [Thermoprotei archaeon]